MIFLKNGCTPIHFIGIRNCTGCMELLMDKNMLTEDMLREKSKVKYKQKEVIVF